MRIGADDRSDGRSLVVAVAPHGAFRAVDARPAPATTPHDLRRHAGRRFVNESNSYMEVGKEMYARDKTSRAVPCWLIFDDRYRKRYAHLRSRPGRFPESLFESGMLKQAWTSGPRPYVRHRSRRSYRDRGAVQCRRVQGIDPDYGRGESAYNRALGDPNRRCTPAWARSTSLRTTPCRSCPVTSAPVEVS